MRPHARRHARPDTGRDARRGLRTTLTAVATSLVLSLPLLGMTSVAASAAPKKGKSQQGVVKVVMKAPAGVPARLRLAGKQATVLDKDASTRIKRVRLKLKAGKYKVLANASVVGGVEYTPVVKKTKVKVKKGTKTKVLVTWRKASTQARIEVTGAETDRISLRWAAGGRKKFMVRRAPGDVAPAKPSRGTKVAEGRGTSATDAGLAAGTRYSYSLFVKSDVKKSKKGKKSKKARRKARKATWVGPFSLTSGTRGTDPGTGAPSPDYALLPHAIVVDATDSDVVEVVDGQVWVTLAARRPAPALGAGMALPISPVLEGGYLGKIAEIAPDGRRVRLVQAGLTEVFSRYDLETDFDRLMQRTRTLAQRPAPSSDFGKGATEGTLASCLSYSTDVSVSVDPEMRATGGFDSYVYSTWGVPHAASVHLEAALTLGASMDLTVAKALECNLGLDRFQLQVVTVPVPMAIKFDAGLTVGAQGALKVRDIGFTTTTTFKANARLGTSPYVNSDLGFVGSTLEPKGEGQVEASLALGGGFTFGPGTGTKDVGAIAGIAGDLDIAKVAVSGAWGELESGADACLKMSLGGAVKAGLNAEAWAGPLSASKSWDLWTDEWDYMPARTWPENCDVPDPDLGTGDVQATLEWDNNDDMDLHVTDPAGETIYYGHKTSESGGQLDVDMIPGCAAPVAGNSSVENVFWPPNGSPSGTYKVQVQEYNDCSTENGQWTLTVRVGGRVVLRRVGEGTSPVYEVTRQ